MAGPTNIGRTRTKEHNEKIRASNIKTWIDNEKGAVFANDMNPASVLSNKQALEIYKLALKRKDFVKKYGQYAKYNDLREQHKKWKENGSPYRLFSDFLRYLLDVALQADKEF